MAYLPGVRGFKDVSTTSSALYHQPVDPSHMFHELARIKFPSNANFIIDDDNVDYFETASEKFKMKFEDARFLRSSWQLKERSILVQQKPISLRESELKLEVILLRPENINDAWQSVHSEHPTNAENSLLSSCRRNISDEVPELSGQPSATSYCRAAFYTEKLEVNRETLKYLKNIIFRDDLDDLQSQQELPTAAILMTHLTSVLPPSIYGMDFILGTQMRQSDFTCRQTKIGRDSLLAAEKLTPGQQSQAVDVCHDATVRIGSEPLCAFQRLSNLPRLRLMQSRAFRLEALLSPSASRDTPDVLTSNSMSESPSLDLGTRQMICDELIDSDIDSRDTLSYHRESKTSDLTKAVEHKSGLRLSVPDLIPCVKSFLEEPHTYQKDLKASLAADISQLIMRMSCMHEGFDTNCIVEKLSWHPYSSRLGIFAPEETLGPSNYLNELVEIIRSPKQLEMTGISWKPQRPRLLETPYDEEKELSSVQFLVRSDDSECYYWPSEKFKTKHKGNGLLIASNNVLLPVLRGASEARHLAKHAQPKLCPTTSSLERFMALQTGGFNEVDQAKMSITIHTEPQETCPTVQHVEDLDVRRRRLDSVQLQKDEAQCPKNCNSSAYQRRLFPVVVSSAMLLNKSSRQLMYSLTEILPTIDLVERDHERVNSTGAKESTQALHATFIGQDTDITLSASTGVFLSTLQKLKQQRIPGLSKPAELLTIRQRLTSVATHYSNLKLFVMSSPQMCETLIDSKDAAAVAEMAGFCAGISTQPNFWEGASPKLVSLFVPGVTIAVAQQLATVLTRDAEAPTSSKLFHVETFWERLLRRTGINYYAAQHILANFDGSKMEGGLLELMCMTRQHRAMNLEAKLAGGKIANHISDILEVGWSKTAACSRFAASR